MTLLETKVALKCTNSCWQMNWSLLYHAMRKFINECYKFIPSLGVMAWDVKLLVHVMCRAVASTEATEAVASVNFSQKKLHHIRSNWSDPALSWIPSTTHILLFLSLSQDYMYYFPRNAVSIKPAARRLNTVQGYNWATNVATTAILTEPVI